MKLDRRSHAHRSAAQALRDLINAELAHEQGVRVGAARADELQAQVDEAREHYRRLSGAEA